jgi:hypothetical protein
VLDDRVHEVAATRGQPVHSVELVIELQTKPERGTEREGWGRGQREGSPSSLWQEVSSLRWVPAHSARSSLRCERGSQKREGRGRGRREADLMAVQMGELLGFISLSRNSW